MQNNNNAKIKNSQETEFSKLEHKITLKKKNNEKFSKMYKNHVPEKSLLRIVDCGTLMQFVTNNDEDKYKLYKSNFCGNRFCPMCAWRKSLKDSLSISIMMKYIENELKLNFIFLTLTVPNVKGKELDNTIKKMNKAFKKLMDRAPVKKATKGFVRKLEVTYQKEEFITESLYNQKEKYYKNKNLKIGDKEPNFNTYHPHFHLILAVSKSYKSDDYISQNKWLALWQQSMEDDSISQIRVNDIKKRDNKEVFEIAKYSAKDCDYLINQNVFNCFYKALKGKQLITFSGVFKDALIEFKSGELDYLKEIDETEYIYLIGFKWVNKKYILDEFRELTNEEYKSINKRVIEELDVG